MVFIQQVVFFQSFLLQKNLTLFIKVLQGRSINWIVSVKQFLLESPFIILLNRNVHSCFTDFFFKLNPLCLLLHNNNIFQLHFISASQEQSYFALKCMQNSPRKVFNPPLWMEDLVYHILLQSICIMGCLIYRMIWYVSTNHLKVFWGQIIFFF